MRNHILVVYFFVVSWCGLSSTVCAAQAQGGPPPVAEPRYDGVPVAAPKGARVLLAGDDLSQWRQLYRPKKGAPIDETIRWKVTPDYIEVVRGKGYLETREPVITTGHLHLEWATPAEVKGNGQGRGNSGVFIGGFPEVQILDSYQNETYPDGQAAALYKRSIPLLNVCRKPGEWQCYDIYVERAQEVDGKQTRKARITVYHNNVLVQDGYETTNKSPSGTLKFQDHGNPVRFRNIWFNEGAMRPE